MRSMLAQASAAVALRRLRDATPDQAKQRAVVLSYEERIRAAEAVDALLRVPDHVLRDICQQAFVRIHGARGTFVSIIGRDQRVPASFGAPFVRELEGQTMPLSLSICSHVVGHLHAVYEPDVPSNPILHACSASEDIGAYAGVPLIYDGFTVGAVACAGDRHSFRRLPALWALRRAARQIEREMYTRADAAA